MTACIRPQDIHSVGHKYSGDLERSITNVTVNVVMVETPGDRNLIVAECKSGETVRFFMNRAYSLKRGDDCSIEINGLLVHLFDKVQEDYDMTQKEDYEYVINWLHQLMFNTL